jgi:hypothetical protein
MILSFRPLGKNDRVHIEARIVRVGSGPSVILLEDGSVLDFFAWKIRNCGIIKADNQEMDYLIRMGLTIGKEVRRDGES